MRMVAAFQTDAVVVIDVASVKPRAPSTKKNLVEGLTRAGFFEYHSTCMAMLRVVVTTEATDPTRVSGPSCTATYVSESSSMRVRSATRGVTEEVRVEESSTTSHQHGTLNPMEPIGSLSTGEGGKHYGC